MQSRNQNNIKKQYNFLFCGGNCSVVACFTCTSKILGLSPGTMYIILNCNTDKMVDIMMEIEVYSS